MFVDSKTLLAVICFFRIMTVGMATNGIAEIKDNIEDLSLYTSRALKDAIQTYCKRVPILTTNCDQFIARVTNKTAMNLPQFIPPQKVDINDDKSFFDLLVKMLVTINEYLTLIQREMKREEKNACKAATAIDVKCLYPEMCKDSNGDNAIFFCKLHSVHSFLHNFKLFLGVMVPDTVASKTSITAWRQQIFPDIFQRWYAMTILKSSLTQIVIFQKVLTSS